MSVGIHLYSVMFCHLKIKGKLFCLIHHCDVTKMKIVGFFLEFNGPAWLTTESYIFLRFFLRIISIRTNDCNYLIILAAGLKIIT